MDITFYSYFKLLLQDYKNSYLTSLCFLNVGSQCTFYLSLNEKSEKKKNAKIE